MGMELARQFNVLIVDDFSGHLITTKKFLERLPFVNSIQTAKDSAEMIDAVMSDPEINALIIDYDLGENSLNGLQAYTLLQEAGYDIPAILVTGNDVDAFESYRIGIVDVVAKKFFYDFKRLNQAIHKLNNYFLLQDQCDIMLVPAYDGKIRQFRSADILFIEASSAKTLIYSATRPEPFYSDLTLASYEEYLADTSFEKLSRFVFVNVDHIASFDEKDGMITLTNEMKLPVSNSNRKYISKLLAEREKPGSGLARMMLWGMRKQRSMSWKSMAK